MGGDRGEGTFISKCVILWARAGSQGGGRGIYMVFGDEKRVGKYHIYIYVKYNKCNEKQDV